MKIEKGIKNIIFDLGGVLVGLDKNRCVEAFRKIGADDIAYFVDEHRVESLFFDSEVGNISQAEFCQRVRELTKKDIPDKDIVWAWNELLTGIPDFKKECLLRLNNDYRLFLLSNTNVMHWTKCAQDFFPFHGWGVNDYFEQVFLSYEMHLIKPSEEIFKRVLDEAVHEPRHVQEFIRQGAGVGRSVSLDAGAFLAGRFVRWSVGRLVRLRRYR